MEDNLSFNINSLANDENIFIVQAEQMYGINYKTCCNIITYSNNFIEGINKENFQLFSAFWGSVTTNLTLSLFALLRKHQNFSHLILRHVCEALILACYSLSNPDISEFISKDEKGNYIENNKALNKAYKWFKKNYPEQSAEIQLLKDMINKRHAHSSYGNVASLVRFDKDIKEVQISFFDILDPEFYIGGLIGLSRIAFQCIHIVYTVMWNYPNLQIDKDFADTMKKFHIQIKENLKEHS